MEQTRSTTGSDVGPTLSPRHARRERHAQLCYSSPSSLLSEPAPTRHWTKRASLVVQVCSSSNPLPRHDGSLHARVHALYCLGERGGNYLRVDAVSTGQCNDNGTLRGLASTTDRHATLLSSQYIACSALCSDQTPTPGGHPGIPPPPPPPPPTTTTPHHRRHRHHQPPSNTPTHHRHHHHLPPPTTTTTTTTTTTSIE